MEYRFLQVRTGMRPFSLFLILNCIILYHIILCYTILYRIILYYITSAVNFILSFFSLLFISKMIWISIYSLFYWMKFYHYRECNCSQVVISIWSLLINLINWLSHRPTNLPLNQIRVFFYFYLLLTFSYFFLLLITPDILSVQACSFHLSCQGLHSED